MTKREALLEDCSRADVLIAPFDAPQGCGAKIAIDRRRLAETGAATLRFTEDGAQWTTARASGEDRPWSKAPKPRPALRATSEDAREEGVEK